MSVIPVIIKANNRLRLRMVDISTVRVRSIDTPAIVEVYDKSRFILVYPGTSEAQQEFSYDGLTICVGSISGRIYSIVGLNEALNESIINNIYNSIGEGKKIRYQKNIKYSLCLIDAIYNAI